MELKKCRTCGLLKPTTEFYKNSYVYKTSFIPKNTSIHISQCKECCKEYSRLRTKTHGHKRKPGQRREEYLKECIKNGLYIKIGFKYVFSSPIGNLRKCNKCDKYKSTSFFGKDPNSKYGYRTICKKCDLERERKKYGHKPMKIRTKEERKTDIKVKSFLHPYKRGDGCCLYCGEISPWILNNHHLWKDVDKYFTITLCENHHALFTRNKRFLLTTWL